MNVFKKSRSEFPDFKSYTGYRIGVIRSGKGMSREDLAKASGVSVASIKAYELGYTDPLLKTSCAIAKALGCSVDELCGFGEAS